MMTKSDGRKIQPDFAANRPLQKSTSLTADCEFIFERSSETMRFCLYESATSRAAVE